MIEKGKNQLVLNNLKIILILNIILVLTSSALAQIITVKDQKTGEPIALAQIKSEAPKALAITNEKGQADISAFKGATEITISRLGYVSLVTSFAELEKLNFEVTMTPTPFEVHDIVVSASRWRQTTNEIPIRVFTISPTQVALESPQTTADLLGISGKVFIQKSQQAGGSPMFRGFATYRLLYSVDGVRMNNAIFRGGNIQQVISLDPLAIENTEIFFGPGSLVYGSDAIGGVMCFQTIVPKFSLTNEPLITGQAVARFSSANKEKTGHFDVNVGWKKWAFVSSISYFDFDHLRQGSHGPNDYLKPFYVERIDGVDRVITQSDPKLQIPSAYSQMNLMQKIRFQPTPAWDWQYGFHYSETSPYGRYDRHCRLRKGLPRYAEWDYGPQKWMMNTLQLTHEDETAIYNKFSLRLAHQFFEESRIDRDLNDAIRRHRLEEVNAYSINLDWLKSIGLSNPLFYGFEYVFNDVSSTGIDENIITKKSSPGPS
ncbi:MAG: TonB-dependent receptor plug domain-containing protein, partial [Candidatus Aminicenantes bacterium]|nr:TonB-dependent receptor plug domain-containing protein [Candidatus Aminicenantes bacterium]